MALSIYSPRLNAFTNVDTGSISTETLLLNILIELRVQTLYASQASRSRSKDEINDLRQDIVNDPESLYPPAVGQVIVGEPGI